MKRLKRGSLSSCLSGPVRYAGHLILTIPLPHTIDIGPANAEPKRKEKKKK